MSTNQSCQLYKSQRVKLGLSQQALADALEVDRVTIYRREKGVVPVTKEQFLAIERLMT